MTRLQRFELAQEELAHRTYRMELRFGAFFFGAILGAALTAYAWSSQPKPDYAVQITVLDPTGRALGKEDGIAISGHGAHQETSGGWIGWFLSTSLEL